MSIASFMTLIAVSETESYVKAAQSLGVTRYKVMRGVSELESWTGCWLVYVDQAVRLTSRGTEVVQEATEAVEILERLRGSPEIWWAGKMERRKVPWWVRASFRNGSP